MAKVYKNLVLTEAQILFDTNTLKTIFRTQKRARFKIL